MAIEEASGPVQVRGIEKTLMVGLWMAITYNALLWIGEKAASL